MNFHDSERMIGILKDEGYNLTDNPDKADLIILNTCSIREKAEQKFYSDLGRLRKLKKTNPRLKIGVGGCIAQQAAEKIFKKVPYVNLVLGPQNIESLPDLIGTEKSTSLEDRPDNSKTYINPHRFDRIKAWVTIMYGCDNFCSYCVVPYTRGRERSRPWIDIYREVKELSEAGYKEVTLLGQNVNSYGSGLEDGMDFPELLYKIHSIDGIKRIRFVTSHPKDFSRNLVNAIKELSKVCEHIHLPLQSGSDSVLNLMKRGYIYSDYKEEIELLRAEVPGIAITTDIITGFPGESEEDFEKTVKALKENNYDGIFAFKYSKRPNTSAVKFPDHISDEVKAKRLSKVLEIQDEITLKKNKELIGKEVDVLVEGKSKSGENKMAGRTRTNKIVNFSSKTDLIGEVIKLRVIEARHHSLDGEPFDFAQGKPL